MTENEYDLTKSSKALGKLYPILKDKDGNIIDGFHRQNADTEWQSITLDSIDNPVKLELARLAVNYCRRAIPKTEIEQRIVFLIKNGMKPEEIADQTGINIATIYRHMPKELKDQERSEATKKGIEEHRPRISEVSSKTSDTVPDKNESHSNNAPDIPDKPTPKTERLLSKTELMPCDCCKIPTHISRMRTLDLCPLCFERLTKNNKIKEA
jgi:hypothetical protein